MKDAETDRRDLLSRTRVGTVTLVSRCLDRNSRLGTRRESDRFDTREGRTGEQGLGSRRSGSRMGTEVRHHDGQSETAAEQLFQYDGELETTV